MNPCLDFLRCFCIGLIKRFVYGGKCTQLIQLFYRHTPLKLKNQKYMIRTEHNRIKHPTGNKLAIYTGGPRGLELGMTNNKSSDSSYWPADWYSNLKPTARLRFHQILRGPVPARGKINHRGWLAWRVWMIL